MKKILFAAIAIVAMGFVSCGSQTNPSETVDTVIIDTIDSVAVDTIVTK